MIVVITGTYLTGATVVSFGAGIAVNSFTVDSATQITADISISVTAPLGGHDVTVTAIGGTATLVNGFTVTAAMVSPPPPPPPPPGGDGWYGSVYGTAGNYLGSLTGWRRLKIVRRVNSPDKIELVLDGRHEAVSILSTDAIVQFYRQNRALGIDPYKEAEGFCRDILHDWNQKAQYEYTAIFAGYEDLLDTRVLLGGDDEKFATSGYPAETVMKKVVEIQSGLTGTRNMITNAIQGLVIEHSLDRGAVFIGYNTGQRLLEYLQAIGDSKNMAFKVIVDSVPGTFKFKAYPNPYGADRTAINVIGGRNEYGNIPVVFSEQRRNVETIGYHLLRDGEGNVAIDRVNNLVVIGPGESDSPWNHREFCLSVGPDDDPNAVADRDLSKMIAREEAAVQIMQTPQCCYGRHYFLGDWVTVYIAAPGLEKAITKAITQVTITVERIQGQMDESIDVVLSDRPVAFNDPLQESIMNLSGRVGNVERRIT